MWAVIPFYMFNIAYLVIGGKSFLIKLKVNILYSSEMIIIERASDSRGAFFGLRAMGAL